MAELEPLEVGVVFWTGGELGVDASPSEIVESVRSLGLRCGQIAVHGAADIGAASGERWKEAIEGAGLTVVTAFCAFNGESYASIPTCTATVGYVPRATRAEREERTYEVSEFAHALGVPALATHIGCLPEDRTAEDYAAVRDLVRRICDHCASREQNFALETGQEPAEALSRFILDVERENLRVNFDPANLILYGSGEPLAALDAVKDRLITVHCKDATRPKTPGEWGRETPLGEGDVGMDRFVAKLKQIGYTGPLTIEREIVGEEQRADILEAIALLEGLRG